MSGVEAQKIVKKYGIKDEQINAAIESSKPSGSAEGVTDTRGSEAISDANKEAIQRFKTSLGHAPKEKSKIADGIRKAKLDLSKLSGGGMQSNILGIPVSVYNSVVEVVALAVEGKMTLSNAIKNQSFKLKYLNFKSYPFLYSLYFLFDCDFL